MNSFIIDSTYKENFVIDQNNINTIIPCNNITNNLFNDSKIKYSDISSNQITHYNKNSKFNPYSIVDYL